MPCGSGGMGGVNVQRSFSKLFVDFCNGKFMDNQPKGDNLPFLKPEDAQYFDKLLVDVDEEMLSPEEAKVNFVILY